MLTVSIYWTVDKYELKEKNKTAVSRYQTGRSRS